MKKRTVLIVFGGYSTEYYVSCNSASGILEYINKDQFHVVTVGITIEGKWLYTEAAPDEIKDGKSWIKHPNNKYAMISSQRGEKQLLIFDASKCIRVLDIDCAFPVIHGYGGEDGSIQGLLEVANIPYVGSNITASANAMDKQLTRLFADHCGLKQPKCIVLKKHEYKDKEIALENLIDFGFPIYVKPASFGSSIGITKVNRISDLDDALQAAFQYEDKILIEEGIIGSEIKVSVIGNQLLDVGAICELRVPKNAVNDYKTKYISSSSIKKIPANLPDLLMRKVKKQACAIYKELNCSGFARVDFFLDKNNELYFNEINTIPGISKKSIFTLMFEEAGVPYPVLITRLIELAFERTKQVAETRQSTFNDILTKTQ